MKTGKHSASVEFDPDRTAASLVWIGLSLFLVTRRAHWLSPKVMPVLHW